MKPAIKGTLTVAALAIFLFLVFVAITRAEGPVVEQDAVCPKTQKLTT